jgi:ribose-phosphate pyrophosphokinase
MGAPVNDNIMELMICVDALKRASVSKVTAIIPYFCYARQDRNPMSRAAISAKLLANLITKSGVDKVITTDIHVNHIQGFFDIPLENLSTSNIFAEHIKNNHNSKDIVIVSPDFGGINRVQEIARLIGCEFAVIDKKNGLFDQKNLYMYSVFGNVAGKYCIIVDDIIDSGRTLINAVSTLEKNGVLGIDAYITHAVLSKRDVDYLDKINLKSLYITDSIGLSEKIYLNNKIKIITISPLLAQALSKRL